MDYVSDLERTPTDLEDFEAKIDHEGGIYSALQYGLRADEYYPDLPQRVREAWNDLVAAFEEIDALADEYHLAVRHASE